MSRGWSQDWGGDGEAVVPPVQERPEVVVTEHPPDEDVEVLPLPKISETLAQYVPGDILAALRAEERSLGLVAEPPQLKASGSAWPRGATGVGGSCDKRWGRISFDCCPTASGPAGSSALPKTPSVSTLSSSRTSSGTMRAS